MVAVRIGAICDALGKLDPDETISMTYNETRDETEFIIAVDTVDGNPEVESVLHELLDDAQVREYASRYGIPEEALRQFIGARAF